MAKYRKRPVVIEAKQWWPGEDIEGVCCGYDATYMRPACMIQEPHIHTIHDNQIVFLSVGDYIIAEPDGEHYYPCKPDIFAMTYEPVTMYEGIELVQCTDNSDPWLCTCDGPPPRSAEEHALRHARYDKQGNRLKNPDGSWVWGT